jgi:succinate dehydrogenase/fumarate reductase flavoprotein subunit
VRRTEKGLKLGLEALQENAARESRLAADDLHGLMRVHEARNIRLNAEIMATAALARDETRTGSAHWRLDHPQSDDEHWRKFVLVERGAAGPTTATLDSSRPLADAFAKRHAAADNRGSVIHDG